MLDPEVRAAIIKTRVTRTMGLPLFRFPTGVRSYAHVGSELIPRFDERNDIEVRNGTVWLVKHPEPVEWDYQVPADGYTPLGGDTTDMVGYLRHESTVYLGRYRTYTQLQEAGFLSVERRPLKNNGVIYLSSDISGADLSYQLTAHGDRLVLAAGIDEILVRGRAEDMAEALENNKYFMFGYPVPTFAAAVKAAALWPKAGIMAAKVPVRLVDGEGKELKGTSWQLMHNFAPTGEWLRSARAMDELLRSPAMAQAVAAIDQVAWAIACEVFHYMNIGKTSRRLKGAGLLLLGAFVADLFDAGISGDDVDSTVDEAVGVAALDGVSMPDGLASAAHFGDAYAEDVRFGLSGTAYDQELGKSVTVEFANDTTSWGTTSTGRSVFMNSRGDLVG